MNLKGAEVSCTTYNKMPTDKQFEELNKEIEYVEKQIHLENLKRQLFDLQNPMTIED